MKKFFDQIFEHFKKLKRNQKIIVVSAVSIVFFIMVFSLVYAGKTEWTVLFSNLDMKKAAKIKKILDDNNFKYTLESGGATILVPVQTKSSVTMKIAEENALPESVSGWAEIFKSTTLSQQTRQREKIDYLRGLQGELEYTISQIEQIERCRVHIVIPETELFEDDQQPTTASIILKTKPLEELDASTVKGIVNLVSFAVEGLTPQNVRILDMSGKDWSSVIDFSDPEDSAKKALTILDIKKDYERELAKKASGMLTKVMGPGNVAVEVALELDFDKIEHNIQTFAPPIPGEDTGIKRSEEIENEAYKGTGVFPGGVPGTDTNIPGYKGVEKEQSDYKRNRMISNFEINKEDIHKIKTPGSIKRMTVSVLIDDEYKLKDEQKTALTDNVKTSIGFVESRGDEIQFTQIRFDSQVFDDFKKELEAERRRQLIMILVGVFLVVAALSGWLVARWIRKRREERERLIQEQQEEETILHIEEPFGPVLTVEEQERREMEERLRRYAKNNSKQVAQLLRMWLIDEH